MPQLSKSPDMHRQAITSAEEDLTSRESNFLSKSQPMIKSIIKP
jgi:hypothetical protein